MRGSTARSAEVSRAPDTRPPSEHAPSLALRFAERMAIGGLFIYAVAAPHSIAGAWLGLSVGICGWFARTLLMRRWELRRTPLDLPLWLFFAWSVVSAFLSAEPHVSLLKLGSVSSFLIFYVVQAIVTRRTALMLASLMIASGVAGVLWSAGEIIYGRGVVIDQIAPDSPFRAETLLQPGDDVWRAGGRRVSAVREIDEAIARATTGAHLSVSVISQGEHVEWAGPLVTNELKQRASPSGLAGTRPTHRFRASGWTRHYETFAETLQILAQLALGLALAYRQRTFARWRVALYAAAFVLLAAGIAFTAMRTVLVAFAFGAIVVAWRAVAARRARLVVALAVLMIWLGGALVVWQTRAAGALHLRDESSRLRAEVARVALARVALHPVFGHGMDAVQRHWTQWGFPGTEMIHAHSTPLQIAFDRGVPALLLWLWILAAFWLFLTRAETSRRASVDAGAHGLLLGATGAVAGFFASSLVNYNFGDAEVALVIWWLMGTVVKIVNDDQ